MAFGDFGGDTRGASNSGFWGSLTDTFTEGVGNVFTKVLPVWAANELKTQQSDQLNDALFNPNTAPPRIDDGLTTSNQGQAVRTGLLFDNINVSGAAILGLAIAVVAVVVVART